MKAKGKIIKAERVITAEEYWNKYFYDGPVHDSPKIYVQTAFNAGDKNGQLKRDLDYRKLVEAAREVIFPMEISLLGQRKERLKEALESIPPLENIS